MTFLLGIPVSHSLAIFNPACLSLFVIVFESAPGDHHPGCLHHYFTDHPHSDRDQQEQPCGACEASKYGNIDHVSNGPGKSQKADETYQFANTMDVVAKKPAFLHTYPLAFIVPHWMEEQHQLVSLEIRPGGGEVVLRGVLSRHGIVQMVLLEI